MRLPHGIISIRVYGFTSALNTQHPTRSLRFGRNVPSMEQPVLIRVNTISRINAEEKSPRTLVAKASLKLFILTVVYYFSLQKTQFYNTN